ncbi:hypothetical protein CAPTEDRAFT_223835 [Capitella teleta]|uniref:Uncharacterized protein n=1 Tax=Capitella teleta TaxID=283909 RepID=R7U6U3_CAPTE|nr:hypothetical protein CAPTEDRAFT_223835 [Capitella teleta]|eukprot:ELU01709.1 hypothetical protein CAPTEDRAFT_223835 [Capitella teleta]
MSLRGMKFDFEPGEHVLCFEPDLTKARVLYEAKILEQSVRKDHHGHRKPDYSIHFQGWNSSWDRVVSATFIVKKNNDNCQLMQRLAHIARQFKSNKARLRKIDNVLREHFGRKLKFDSESSDSEPEEEEEEQAGGGGEETDEEDPSDEEGASDENEDKHPNGNWEAVDDEVQLASNGVNLDGEQDEDLEDLEDKENELNRAEDLLSDSEPPSFEFDIPENLIKKLEDDCVCIKVKSKLVRLPADLNIITLLEGYVKNFAVNTLCATAEKQRAHPVNTPERNIALCKEVVDGLRVFFDFALPNILLYHPERSQYERLSHKSHPMSIKEEPLDEDKPLQSPCLRSHHSPRPFSPEPSAKRKAENDDEESIGSRRSMRLRGNDSPPPLSPRLRRDSLRSARQRNISERSGEDPVPTASVEMPPSAPLGEKEAAVDEIFSWNLLPKDLKSTTFMPSTVYGPQHLLRLFVKLPGLLADMRIPSSKQENLTKHLQLFLDYLSNRCSEFFPTSAYDDASHELSKPSAPRHR